MIFVDDQIIKLGSVTLPGLVLTIEIDGSATIEDAKVEGAKKIPRQATGYEDYKVNISLELGDSAEITKEQKLTQLQNLFHASNRSKPIPYELINKHTQLRGIKKVIFKNLSTVEDSKSDTIIANLEFVEYERIKIRVKDTSKSKKDKTNTKSSKKKGKKSSGSKRSTTKSKKKSAPRPKTSSEYQSYLKHRGKSPSIEKRYKGKSITLLQ